jgi:uncharacterized damage-inducible protein DinB
MASDDTAVREHLQRALAWEDAHATFDKAVHGIPVDKRGSRAAGFEHSPWQLVEHIRLAQDDILDFCVNSKYVHSLKWPDDYWPKDPAPPSVAAWDASVAAALETRERFKQLAREIPDLGARVPTGTDQQTYLRALLLVVDHNAYHVGQLVAVRKALGIWG